MSDDGVTRDEVIWAYRILLDRDPENDLAIASMRAGCRSTRDLRAAIVTSAEYQEKNPDFAQTNTRTVVIKELEDGPRIVLDLADHAIGLPILRGEYEVAEVQLARACLAPGDVAIDAGAHVGFFALQMAAVVGPRGHVYAFEPFEENAALLERGIRENGFEDRMTLERAALGAASGISPLYFAEETLNRGGAFTLPAGAAAPAGLQHRTVRTVRLDDYPGRRPVRLVKMDVEGAEPLVLAGAERLLREDRPAILAEVHAEQMRRVSSRSPHDLFREMRGRRYAPFGIRGDGGVAPLDEPPAMAVTTVAFLPEEHGSLPRPG
jgi:FkbM family methyltransferase